MTPVEVGNLFIDRLVKWLLPRENRFFVYLNSIATNVGVGGDIFAELRTASGPEDFVRMSNAGRAVSVHQAGSADA